MNVYLLTQMEATVVLGKQLPDRSMFAIELCQVVAVPSVLIKERLVTEVIIEVDSSFIRLVARNNRFMSLHKNSRIGRKILQYLAPDDFKCYLQSGNALFEMSDRDAS